MYGNKFLLKSFFGSACGRICVQCEYGSESLLSSISIVCAKLRQSYITPNCSAVTLKGSQRMGRRAKFIENLCAPPFNEDLANERTFSQIHLSGQYLKGSVQPD
jgi:hypothetical protein